MIEHIKEYMETSGEVEACVDSLAQLYSHVGFVIDPNTTGELAAGQFNAIEELLAVAEEEDEGDDDDDDDDEDLGPVCTSMTLFFTELCKSAPEQVAAIVNVSLGRINALSRPETKGPFRNWVSCLLIDCIEHCHMSSLVPDSLPLFLRECDAPSPSNRQSAVFGIGVCAQHSTAEFLPFAPNCVALILRLICAPDARDEDQTELVSDNAVTSLLKILRYSAHGLPQDAVVAATNALVTYLPAKADEEEIPVIHAAFARMAADPTTLLAPLGVDAAQRLTTCIAKIAILPCTLETRETLLASLRILRDRHPDEFEQGLEALEPGQRAEVVQHMADAQ
mmetsp:Transcript_42262/g.91879  ORF Transcript_42262/g.91879 Transcript_42262/m.91879 type:complete len:337 (+) Transcript_42262:94-1104(+)